MSHRSLPCVNGLTISENRPNATSRSPINLHIRYTDYRRNLKENRYETFMSTDTIYDVIVKFLKTAGLNDINSTDVALAELDVGNQRRHASALHRFTKLNQLGLRDNDTLFFELVVNASTPKPRRLVIFGPNRLGKIESKWDPATTTLQMLLTHVIDAFLLQSVKREQIHLLTLSDDELDVTSHSDKLLSQLGIIDGAWIFVQIVESPSSSSVIHVECTYTNGQLQFDVPFTSTIKDLKQQIEIRLKDYILLDYELFDHMHHQIDLLSQSERLYNLGLKPGDTMYASLRIALSGRQLTATNNTSNGTTRSTSLIAKQQLDEVIIVYQISAHESVTTKASVHDTVAELIRALETIKKIPPSTQFQISCRSVNFTSEQLSSRLSTLGIKPGDVLIVRTVQKIPDRHSDNSSYLRRSSELPRSSRSISTPLGLANLGNTCYMNSALQCLARAIPLTQFFLDGFTQNASDDDKYTDSEWNPFYTVGSITGAYADVLKNLWLPKKTGYYYTSFRPSHIKETIGVQAPRFATWDQQDAQEFMTFLLDEIHKEMKEKNSNDSITIIEELFSGKIQSTITCSECKHEEKTTNPISLLSLPLTQPGRQFTVKFIGKDGKNDSAIVNVPEDAHVKNLIQAFEECRPSNIFIYAITAMTDDGPVDLDMPISNLSVSEVVLIEEDDFASTSRSSRFDRKVKQLTLVGCLREFCSPEILEDSWLCQQETCKKRTKATKQLQFSSLPPILIIQLKRFSHRDGLRDKIETFVQYPLEGLDLSSFLSTSEEEAIYDLFAVTNHMGSIYGGHYIAYAQHEINGTKTWYSFDDSYVTSYCYEGDIVSKNAYLLFYKRRDKSKRSTAITTSS